jgi:hypothetical protein
VPVADVEEWRLLLPTAVECERAAGVEAAALGDERGIWRFTLEDGP